MTPRTCRNCNKNFLARRGTIEEGKRKGKEWGIFCSKSCKSTGKFHHKYNGGLSEIEKLCLQCKKTFITTVAETRYRPTKYCSCKCKSLAMRVSKGSIISSMGYRLIYSPGKYKNDGRTLYYPEHRYVIEQHIGRMLRDDEVVHHKNRNKLDNRIENLIILTVEEHSKEHIEDRNKAVAAYWTAERRKDFGKKIKAYRKEHYWSTKKATL